MSDRVLTLEQIEQIAVDAAERCGLAIASDISERKRLHINLQAGPQFPVAPHRSKVALWADLAGVYIADFDDEWDWVITGDENAADQEESIRQMIDVAGHYLRGEGQERLREWRWRWSKPTRFLDFDIPGESISLRENRRRRSAD